MPVIMFYANEYEAKRSAKDFRKSGGQNVQILCFFRPAERIAYLEAFARRYPHRGLTAYNFYSHYSFCVIGVMDE